MDLSRFFSVLAVALLVTSTRTEEADGRWAAFTQTGWELAGSSVKIPDQLWNSELAIVLALKQRNLEFLQDQAKKVSDPEHKLYGQYYTRAELKDIAGPSDDDVAAVTEFLQRFPEGTFRFSAGRDLVRFRCSIRCVERAFGTVIAAVSGPTTPGNNPLRASTPLKLPERVERALDGVSLNAPIFMPPRPKPKVTPPFVYPATGLTSVPRLHPKLTPGDGMVGVRFTARCADGTVNTNTVENGICAAQDHGNSIVSFELVILQDPNRQKVVQLPATKDVLGQRIAECVDRSSCIEFNVTVGNLVNYAKTTARIRAIFADGTASVFSEEGEVQPAWPQPWAIPALLGKLYGIPLQKPIRHPRNTISVVEFQGQYYNPHDLEAFFRLMGVRTWSGEGKAQPLVVGPNRARAGSVLGGESQLDLQYIMAMAPNVTTVFWSVPGAELNTTQEPFLDWLMQLADTSDDEIPLVHSVSYADDEDQMPLWFKTRICQEFMKLGLRGISVLTASGDDGAIGYASRSDASKCSRAMPMFPASCPWVTAIGGTQLSQAAKPVCSYSSDDIAVNCDVVGEVGCSVGAGGRITSGGGFSYDFPRPWYQTRPVDEYFVQQDNPVPNVNGTWPYNPAGRAYPDISAVASNYLVWMGDHLVAESGTSASTPLAAAMVAHWNEERLRQGLPVLGFLNPLLYGLGESHPEAYNDVVIGDNKCNGEHCCETGFGASRGWDAVTGLGTPKFHVIDDLLRVQSVQFQKPLPTLLAASGKHAGSNLAMAVPILALASSAAAFFVMGSVAWSFHHRRRTAGELAIFREPLRQGF